MKKFLTRFLCFLGVVFLMLVLGFGTLGYKMLKPTTVAITKETILELTLDQTLQERPSSRSFPLSKPALNSVRDIIDGIQAGANNPHVKGLVVYIEEGIFSGIAQIQELRNAIHRFRQTGKKTYIYADSYGELSSGMGLYYFASAFDEIWLHPLGSLNISGLSVIQPYGRKLLDTIGIQPEIERREEFKTAYDSVQEYEMTAANRHETQELLDSLVHQMKNAISQEREISPAIITELMNKPPIYKVKQAQQEGLIEGLLYKDQLVSHIKKQLGAQIQFIEMEKLPFADPLKSPENSPKIAVVFAHGVITKEESRGRPLMASANMEMNSICEALKDIQKEDSIKAVVVRVNTPGGSPTASEDLWYAIKQVSAHKPVIISMGDVAASGGYWIAMAGTKIVANPGTITGSIGVIAGKFATQTMWDKIGVKWDVVQTSAYAGVGNMIQPFSEHQKEWFKNLVDYLYQVFIDKVKEGRHMTEEQVRAIAKGRVWTGSQALEVKLVDQLGDLEDAIELARKEAKLTSLTRADLEILYLPRALTWIERLTQYAQGDLPFASMVRLSIRACIENIQELIKTTLSENQTPLLKTAQNLPKP